MRIVVAFFLSLLFAGASMAQAKSPSHADLEFDPALFAEQRRALEREIATSERYRGIMAADRRSVVEALDRMERNLSGISSISQLNTTQRMNVFNDQELINTLLTQAAADSRLVCTKETPVGTRLAKRVCKTVGERRIEREAAREVLRDSSRLPIRDTGG